MAINRKGVFDLIREGIGPLSQKQVNELTALLDRWDSPAVTISTKKFFDSIRANIFGGRLSADVVKGCSAILDEWQRLRWHKDSRHLAYILATVQAECRFNLDIEEIGKGRGKAYGEPDPVTGKTYYGRGPVQLTWKANYKKMGDLIGQDLVHKPELVLEPAIGIQVTFEGMYKGISQKGDFTGRSLEDYFNSTTDDPVNARRIINGTDRAGEIAGYYRKYVNAFKEAAE